MRVASKTTSIIASGILTALVVPAEGAITYLNHFNSSSSYNVVTANGDYAGGSPTATISGSPTTGTGFFPGSAPNNLAYQGTNGQYVEFNAYDGNLNYESQTSGGFTVGAWVKFAGATPVGRIFTIGQPDLSDDSLLLDYGNFATAIPRALFRDGATFSTPVTTGAALNVSDWVYMAVSVDITNDVLKYYAYDSTGALIGATPVSGAIDASNWNPKNPLAVGSRIRVGDFVASGTTLWVDELSLDDEVLSDSAITARVASMVAGNQLAIPEPSTGVALLTAGATLLHRRRRPRLA